MSSRYDRRDPSRALTRAYDDPPEDYRARIELLNVPQFLVQDRDTCIRFVESYFTRVTHFCVHNVELEESVDSEAGEITGSKCYFIVPERDAFRRLVVHSKPVGSAASSRDVEPAGQEYEHTFDPKYMPTWSFIKQKQGENKGESVQSLLFRRKVAFRVDSLSISTEPPPVLASPRPSISTTAARPSSSRLTGQPALVAEPMGRVEPVRPPSEPVWYEEPSRSTAEPIRVIHKEPARPVSWDVEEGQVNVRPDAPTMSSRVEIRPPEDFVGFQVHYEETDPWIDKVLDGTAKENIRWLELHREYLLRPQIGTKLSTKIPSFVEDRTIVMWQLAKTWSRVDDVKVRLMPDGWAPAGRIGFISFMSHQDQLEIMRKCNGYNFPKQVAELKKTSHWLVADEVQRGGAAKDVPVAQAVEGEWCPVASKLVNGKLDPAAASRNVMRSLQTLDSSSSSANHRALPPSTSEHAPHHSSDALDYSATTGHHKPLPATSERGSQRYPISDALDYSSTAPSYESLPNTSSARDSPHKIPSSVQPDKSIYLPVNFLAKAATQEGGPAVPGAANEVQLRKLLHQYGTVENVDFSGTVERMATVKYYAGAGIATARESARKATFQRRFAECYELRVDLAQLPKAQQSIWADWDWTKQSDMQVDDPGSSRNPPEDQSASVAIASSIAGPPVLDAGEGISAVDNPAEVMDEIAAFLDNLAASPSQSPPPAPVAVPLAAAPPTTLIPAKAVTAVNVITPSSPTIGTQDTGSSATAPAVSPTIPQSTTTTTPIAQQTAATTTISRPTAAPVPVKPLPSRGVGLARPSRPKAKNAFLTLMATQDGLVASDNAKRPSSSEAMEGSPITKKKRFE
ncbi:hypothetical protein QFC19_000073 [Naganishia cerealis]|uniref:Uncharacterized protein n=1 Tax=Naganishia cerealis TaxID=610337 RepID=A0ACC2WRT4_9TREE|nr:hypothetical protein QFC19_000073 [Naganishia cerealis]